jgi:hypothetical protein
MPRKQTITSCWQKFNFHAALFFKKREGVLPQISKLIHDRADAYFTELSAYGLTTLILTGLQNDIGRFSAMTAAPRQARVTKQAITARITLLFRDTDKLLKLQIDSVMARFKTSNSEFFSTYKAARQIIKLGATHTSLRLTLKDRQGNPVAGANISLLQNNRVRYTGISSASGTLSIPRVSPLAYDLQIEKPNFKTHIEAGINFRAGKRVKRAVLLAPAVL